MGSLFQLREYWFTSFPQEEFGSYALTIGDVDNTKSTDKIVVGSFQGTLRIMNPSIKRGEMQATDILFEKKFPEPILQVEIGPFEPVVDGICQNLLAVLFPRRFMFLEILRVGGEDRLEDGQLSQDFYYICNTSFETTFEHSAYNFVSGNFGKLSYKMVCVQSLDGCLKIIDYNKVLYTCIIPPNQFLVPGCLEYCSKRDALLTNNSSLFLMCYSFSSIINATTSEKDLASSRISPSWAFNLGDDAVAIKMCSFLRGAKDQQIVVLCSYKFLVLSDNGEVIASRRLNAEASCLCSYPLPELNCENIIVGMHNESVNIFSDVALEWSAKMSSGIPLCLSVGGLCGVAGMIVSLNSENKLCANYLGTDPAEGPIISLESKNEAYADMCAELKEIQQSLKENENAAGASGVGIDFSKITPSSSAKVGMVSANGSSVPPVAPALSAPKSVSSEVAVAASAPLIEASAPSSMVPEKKLADLGQGLSLAFANSSSHVVGEKHVFSLLVKLDQTTNLGVLLNVELFIRCVEPLVCETKYKKIPRLEPGETVTIPVTVVSDKDKDNIIPSSLELSAVAVYRNKKEDIVAFETTTRLPLSLVAKAIEPVKNTGFSIQINTDRSPPPSLLDLFPDMTAVGPISPNVISMEYINGADVTVLVSKNAARFKLQGSTLEGLWLVADELMTRVRTYYNDSELVFEIPDDPPYKDLCAVIETHVAVRQELLEASAELERGAVFFRTVQKRLITHFRDRNPSSMSSLELLLKECYKNIQEKTEAEFKSRSRQRQACAMLNCCAKLFCMILLTKNRANFSSPEDQRLLQGIFSCDVSDSKDVGWEELTETALVKLMALKTAKSGNKAVDVSLKTLNLKRYIQTLIEFVNSGKSFFTN